jgi:hypothetical protein
MEQRLTQSKDLGEIMVIAHAAVAAEAGATVTVLIDDGKGADIASSEIVRLERLRASGQAVGSIKLASTFDCAATCSWRPTHPRQGNDACHLCPPALPR